jgi:hypothetical protein
MKRIGVLTSVADSDSVTLCTIILKAVVAKDEGNALGQ